MHTFEIKETDPRRKERENACAPKIQHVGLSVLLKKCCHCRGHNGVVFRAVNGRSRKRRGIKLLFSIVSTCICVAATQRGFLFPFPGCWSFFVLLPKVIAPEEAYTRFWKEVIVINLAAETTHGNKIESRENHPRPLPCWVAALHCDATNQVIVVVIYIIRKTKSQKGWIQKDKRMRTRGHTDLQTQKILRRQEILAEGSPISCRIMKRLCGREADSKPKPDDINH